MNKLTWMVWAAENGRDKTNHRNWTVLHIEERFRNEGFFRSIHTSTLGPKKMAAIDS